MAELSSNFETGITGNTIAVTDAGSPTIWDETNVGAGFGTPERHLSVGDGMSVSGAAN